MGKRTAAMAQHWGDGPWGKEGVFVGGRSRGGGQILVA